MRELEQMERPGRRLEAAVTALINNRPLASRAIDSRVCLVCLACHFSGEENVDMDGEDDQTPLNAEVIRRTLLRGGSSARAMAMAAAAHNREMHAANGNIHFLTGHAERRIDTIERLRDLSTRGDKYVWRTNRTVSDYQSEAELELPAMTIQTGVAGGSQSTSALPTVHCYLGTAGAIVPDDFCTPREGSCTPDASEGGSETETRAPEPTPGPSKAGRRKDCSVDDKKYSLLKKLKGLVKLKGSKKSMGDETKQVFNSLSIQTSRESLSESGLSGGHTNNAEEAKKAWGDLYWFGVGSEPHFDVAEFIPSAGCIEVLEAERDPGSRDDRINPSQSRIVWTYIKGGARLQSAVAGSATTIKGDVRLPALKVRLLDCLKGYGLPFPSGVNWAVPYRMDVPAEVDTRDVLDGWNYQFVAIPPLVLDVAFATRADGELPVGGEVWNLRDPTVAVVVLDAAASDSANLWALQILMALPYPLLTRTEWFLINNYQGQDEIEPRAIVRTEALVTIPSEVKKLVLIYSGGTGFVNIGNQHIAVQAPDGTRLPELRAHDAHDLIFDSARLVMGYPFPASKLLDRWASERLATTWHVMRLRNIS
ncbi:unnamed protein product [Colias eurytheme]|nr:unnamed protein product [Colias eurytheme]